MRSNRLSVVLSLLLLVSLAACAEKEDAPATSGGHAAAGVVPGSYEDWCAEHEVPESQCTRCNAALIPAFKATNDWCKEHDMPESQCRLCNPNLKIERPPKPSGG